MKRLLITGAAGLLGSEARPRCADLAETLRLSDVVDIPDPAKNEEIVLADLSDLSAVMDLLDGVDGVVHFGGCSFERPFDQVLNGNVIGMYNLYEAARAHGVQRIFFASSNHTIGFHPVDRRLDAETPPFADGLYGASKVWGEQLALVYWKKYGIETLRCRIGSSFPAPRNRRMLSTWLSFDDLFSLVARTFAVPRLGCPVVYGQSANAATYWDNGSVDWLGWHPKDSTEGFRASIEAEDPTPDRDSADYLYHGGGFTTMPIQTSED